MRGAAALLAAVLLRCPASAGAPETLRAAADAALAGAIPLAAHPDLAVPREPVLQPPLAPRPLRPSETPGAVVARISLPGLAESNRRVLTRVFGARVLDLGMAADAALSSYFLTFSDPGTTTLAALGDLSRLRGSGIDARIDAGTAYNFKVSVNIFSPVRGSTLKMTPLRGTRGPAHEIKTGAVLDAVRARSSAFRAFGRELWLFYGADVLPDGSGFAETRSFLFVKEDGLSSKAWPLAESALAADADVVVDLGGLRLGLNRSSSGELVVRESR